MTLLHVPEIDLGDFALADGRVSCAGAWVRGWTIAPPMTVSEWADQHRKLSRTSSPEPGDWCTDRTPYLREIMDCLSAHSPVREVALMKSTQVGGTEVLLNWYGYIVHFAPGPTMAILPTVDTGERWSKQRFAPMIAEMPVLSEKIAPARSRDSGNTTLLKEFPGGIIIISGANSTASLRSNPIKNLGRDEIDEYESDLDEQGSVLELTDRRTANFMRRKVADVSTPTIKGASNIEAKWLEGDQRHYTMPCPHCGGDLVFRIEQLTDDGLYLCEHGDCGKLIAEHHKPAMLKWGRWVPTHPERTKRSYHLNALYSPIGLGYSWLEIAEKRSAARKNPDLQVTFDNTILGLPHDVGGQKLDLDELKQRAGKWVRRTIPRGALVLTVGIDVQHNRWSVVTCAWGRNERCWIIDWVELPGDPTCEKDWDVLDAVFEPIVNSAGVAMKPQCVAIDSGNWTHEVYNWVRRKQHLGVIAVKGSKNSIAPLVGRPTPQDVNFRGKVIKHGVMLWTVGVNAAKSTLMQRLSNDFGREIDEQRFQFPADLPEEFYPQLVSEVYHPTLKRWVKRSGVRNEALDGVVYAYAAACHPTVRVHVKRDKDWARLEEKLEPATADMFAPPFGEIPRETTPSKTSDTPATSQPSPRRAARPRRASGGFATNW